MAYRQASAVPYRIRSGRLEVALITSTGGRWILPKGTVDQGEVPSETAVRETREEAGLAGEIEGGPVGRYHYRKERGRYRVDVFLMRVTVVHDHWQEDGHRRRCWVAVSEAVTRLDGGPLRKILRQAADRLGQS